MPKKVHTLSEIQEIQSKKKQIVVVGIYRSGTSLISGTLRLLGIDIGNHEYLKHPIKNPKGFWECQDASSLNEFLRKICGKNKHTVDKTDIEKVIDHPEANRRVKQYIDRRNEKDVWAVKEPKMIPFFELYEKYLERPYYIFIKRRPESVLWSWKRVEPDVPPEMIEKTYKMYVEMIKDIRERAIKEETPFIDIHYGWYVDNRKEACEKIADFVDREVNQEAIDFCHTYSGGTK